MAHVPSDSFVRQFEARIEEFANAKQVVTRLEEAGCERFFLLMQLELYCNSYISPQTRKETGLVKEFVMGVRTLATSSKKLADRLLDDADEIDRVNREPKISQELFRHAFAPVHLANDMREYASRLKGAAELLQSRYRHSLREEPGNFLALLTDYVKSATGKNHYEDLASLVQVGFATYGIQKDMDAEDVRKIVTGGRRRRFRVSRDRR